MGFSEIRLFYPFGMAVECKMGFFSFQTAVTEFKYVCGPAAGVSGLEVKRERVAVEEALLPYAVTDWPLANFMFVDHLPVEKKRKKKFHNDRISETRKTRRQNWG